MGAESLKSERAKALLAYIEHSPEYPFARVLNATSEGAYDVLDLEVEPELSQERAVDIRPIEPIRIRIPLDDSRSPIVHSRRADFPLNQVHTNYARGADGLCLCIWEEDWNNLRRQLSPQALIERIRDWFARMATRNLHQPHQALEPLLPAGSHMLIIPPGLPTDNWHVSGFWEHGGRLAIAVEAGADSSSDAKGVTFSVFTIHLSPQVHGSLRAHPKNLKELVELLHNLGTELTPPLREFLTSSERLEAAEQHRLVICLIVPKIREEGGPIEGQEVRAFITEAKLSRLGQVLGCTGRDPASGRFVLLVPPAEPREHELVALEFLSVAQRVNREAARFYAGSAHNSDRRLVAVGAGAIGSNVVIGATRAGVGTWTIVDHDMVSPHNVARQFHANWAVGAPKAAALANVANHMLADTDTARPIAADMLAPGSKAAEIRDAIEHADLVVDFSASLAVLGCISDQPNIARAASFFFNPDGRDLVVLMEDAHRDVRLDEIEAQYFLAVATDPRLAGHFGRARVDFVRYTNACQDLTQRLPPWQVQTLSTIAGGRLIGLLQQPEHAAGVWRLDVESGAVWPVSLAVSGVSRNFFSDWRFTVSHAALDKMRRLRTEAAPSETGGILLGTTDQSRCVVHIVDVLPAPPDSVQAPTYFVRGKKDLGPQVETLRQSSAGTLRYLGEWHSHPGNAPARPSPDDENVYAHLEKHIGPTGEPYLMAIRGKEETWLRLGCRGAPRGEVVIRDDVQ